MDFEKIRVLDFPEIYKEWMKDPSERYFRVLGEPGKVLVSIGRKGYSINPSLFDENHIIVDVDNGGGNVVFFDDSLGFITFTEEGTLQIKNNILNYLISKGLNAYKEHNDIMIDGKKLIGFMNRPVRFNDKKYVYYGLMMCDTINYDEFNRFIKPDSKKVTCLSEYNISSEEIIKIVEES